MVDARRVVLLVAAAGLLTAVAACRSEPTPPRVVAPEPQAEEETSTADTLTPLEAISLSLAPIATDLDQPLYVTGAGDGSGRLFVVEKTGRIWVFRDGRRVERPLLDIAARVSNGSEQGLLGLAFPPDFAESAYCVINYTDRSGDTVVARLRVSGDVADLSSEDILLTQEQPYANHNGGHLLFGPDGDLYIGLGDGGSGGDPHGNGQNLDTWLGTLLRIQVDRSGQYEVPSDNPFVSTANARPEIWAYGLRNPWRFSFDRETGDLWIGDVGQNAWEEIDFQPAASAGGENYGWNLYEGAHTYPAGEAVSEAGDTVLPVVEYDRQAGKSVTGGYVYRGEALKVLWGTYLYADFVDGRIRGLQRAPNGGISTRMLLDNTMLISSFGEDDGGELYLTDLNGGLYKVLAE
jgi:glucose/arabinose dehydrogenase